MVKVIRAESCLAVISAKGFNKKNSQALILSTKSLFLTRGRSSSEKRTFLFYSLFEFVCFEWVIADFEEDKKRPCNVQGL